MQDSTLITLLTASVFLVSVLMSRFYLSVTQEKGQDTWFAKLRAASFVLPFVALIGSLAFLLTVGDLSRGLVLIPFAAAAAALASQFVMVVAVFFDKDARRKALTGVEAKVLTTTLRATVALTVFTLKSIQFVLKLSAKGDRRRGMEDGAPRPWGYHGYESYTEKAERIHGKLF